MAKVQSQITGNKGLYFVCYELSRLHWNVMPTSRNARGVDVIAYDLAAENFVGIQVKALSKRAPVPLGTKIDNLMGDYWVIVNNLQSIPSAYILTPGEVQSLAHKGEKDGRISFWLQPKEYAQPQFLNAWHRIGTGDVPSSSL
jgi:hypothetical protein